MPPLPEVIFFDYTKKTDIQQAAASNQISLGLLTDLENDPLSLTLDVSQLESDQHNFFELAYFESDGEVAIQIDEEKAYDGKYRLSLRVMETGAAKQPIFFDLVVEVIGLREAPETKENEQSQEIQVDEKGIQDQRKTLDYSDPENPPASKVNLGELAVNDGLKVKMELIGSGSEFLQPYFDE